ncbi:hypothetical protein [Gordonia oryzae]|uniref:hypothetical protein n=1 Tax=Gordonia oryzae TaxID=2487349 RepID=UPI0011CDED42|nr:hypothetical protein [Gordonia oryzae]
MLAHQVSDGDEDSYLGLSRVERRRVRFGARAMLWEASSLKSVRCCGRLIHGDGPDRRADMGVTVKVSPGPNGSNVAGFGNLATCGSVWACPRCAAVIASRRAVEIGNAVREAIRLGGSVYMLTLTMRHDREQRLEDLWEGLTSGWRATFGSELWTGREARVTAKRGYFRPAVMGDADRFQVAGLSRTVECTYGVAGWHLHAHVLVYCVERSMASALTEDWKGLIRELTGATSVPEVGWWGRVAFGARVSGQWRRGLVKKDLNCGAVGVDLRQVTDDGADYIARYLSKSTYDVAAKMGEEAALGLVTKAGRGRNQTPFELLYDLSESVSMRAWGIRTPRHWKVVADESEFLVVDMDTAEVRAAVPPGRWNLWWVWEQGSQRRRQLVWTHRQAALTERSVRWNMILDARGRERADDDIVGEGLGGYHLGEIAASEWYGKLAFRPSWLAELLEAAEDPDPNELSVWMQNRRIELTHGSRAKNTE